MKRILVLTALLVLPFPVLAAQTMPPDDAHHTNVAGGPRGNGSKLGNTKSTYNRIVIRAPYMSQCFSLENSNDIKEFFIPWNTEVEWVSFKKAVKKAMDNPSDTSQPLYKVKYTENCCSSNIKLSSILPDGKICDKAIVNDLYPGQNYIAVPVAVDGSNVDEPWAGAEGDIFPVNAADVLNDPTLNFKIELNCRNGAWVQTVGEPIGSCVPLDGECYIDAYKTNPPTNGFKTAPAVSKLCKTGSVFNTDIGIKKNVDGNWTWQCDGTPTRTNATCYALPDVVTAKCGTAHGASGYTSTIKPSTPAELCEIGSKYPNSPSVPKYEGGTLWRWSCWDDASSSRAYCKTADPNMPGPCGPANGHTYSVLPTDDALLCANPGDTAAGTIWSDYSPISWLWCCNKVGYTVYSPGSCYTGTYCMARKSSYVNCSTAAGRPTGTTPNDYLCVYGAFADNLATVTGGSGSQWEWTCVSKDKSKSVPCTAPYTDPINAACGSSNGATSSQMPNKNLCNPSELDADTTVSGTGPWTWKCLGKDGGTDSLTCKTNICTECSGDVAAEVKTASRPLPDCAVTGTSTWTQANVLTSVYDTKTLVWGGDSLGTYNMSVMPASPPPHTPAYCTPCYAIPKTVSGATTEVPENSCGYVKGTHTSSVSIN